MSIADSDLFMMRLGKSCISVLVIGELLKPITMPPDENIFAMFVVGVSSLDAAAFEKFNTSGSFGLLSHAIVLRGIIENRIGNVMNFEKRMFFPDAEL
jgi:hypothetical protein